MFALLKNNRYLISRRIVQLSVIMLFLGGNYFGWKILIGNYSSATVLNKVVLSDPYATLQILVSGFLGTTDLLVGALIVLLFYAIIGGRVFCGWVCPFGSVHHFVGFLASRGRSSAGKIKANVYRKAQNIKYYILIVFLLCAGIPLISGSLQTGLLDPIPLVTRSFNLIFLPLADTFTNTVSATERFYDGASLILLIFFVSIALNLVIPRFYCRFICPLGALFGIISRFAIWRTGKNKADCSNCGLCEKSCVGGCSPAGKLRISECVLCFNCSCDCEDKIISYQTGQSLAGEVTNPDISRRGFIISLLGGVLAIPAVRLSGKVAANWNNKIIRPPGSLAEEEFLKRCIKCGQCMRICPTNVIQPGSVAGGIENLWTPVLNNRIGSSGCQLNCVACGYICPTAAIRAITLSEKLGKNEFAKKGPIRIGTAFVDRSRCLPWAMDKPCIVCQENCPVSPKAIYTREYLSTVRDGSVTVKNSNTTAIEVEKMDFPEDRLASGDYYLVLLNEPKTRKRISGNTETEIIISVRSEEHTSELQSH